MKKTVILISTAVLMISMLTACSEKETGAAQTASTTTAAASTQRTVYGDDYTMTQAQYTVGDTQTSEKIDEGEIYHITYYDANGYITKEEVYKKGKMIYYYIVSAVDDMGNCIQAKYYTAGRKFAGTSDNGVFFDSAGKQMSETEFERRLGM